MLAGITIRPCRHDECRAILELWRDADSTPSVSDSIDALVLTLQSDEELLLVAEYQNKIIGTVMGGWDGWRGNIYRLAVLPEYRRQGVGQQLVREIEKKIVSKGARKISILVEKSEDTAIAFWGAMKNDEYRPDDRFIRYTKTP
jgi:ribosomal protein S18 acetylase RimI-like enzyme